MKNKRQNIEDLTNVLCDLIINANRQTGRTNRMIKNANEGHTLFFHDTYMADVKRREYNSNPENTKELYFTSIKQLERKYVPKPENVDHFLYEKEAIEKIRNAVNEYIVTMGYNNE